MRVLAHLNGGPRDDELIEVMSGTFYLRRIRRWDEDPMTMTAWDEDEGHYRVRRTFAGDPVPHALDGSVEYDWQGWRPYSR